MKKWILFSILVILLLTLAACGSAETIEPHPTPENPYLEEELAAQVIATAKAEKTQTASRVSPYAEISDEKQTYLAFWFYWNDETVFLPIAKSNITEIGLLSCQLDAEAGLATGELISGWEFVQDECLADETAPGNAPPIIRIPGYFDDGIQFNESHHAETRIWNIIDLNGEYAENFADVVAFIIENDLLGSGDLTLSLHRTDGLNNEQPNDAHVIPSYNLSEEALQVSFSTGQLENFEYVDDVVYALERQFTWKIPSGFSVLDLSLGDGNWFVLDINEGGMESHKTYIQIKGVGAPIVP